MTEENNILDLKSMQKKADEDFQDKVDKSWEGFRKQQELKKNESKELQSLWGESFKNEMDQAQRERDAKIEEEKNKAVQAVEDKYESQGVLSDRTKSKHKSYARLAKVFDVND
ncbi:MULTISPECIES: hypothetical protein [unclassified Lactococcus]|uniref:hypothetical protein n=1 Tax=unclassified Lactococcus TaxID=2643510 RepID=UPI0011C86353|nr:MULTISPECIES: hypothetical protein [unclassified Lactococcus]MQW23261.1 hypothetical protein [Lactococcus sp. dk101]TXK38071.1 hypothetical protein FVP42_06575 [Lactococcus sp. dk310]TXK49750.1 hypothetical protein FVP43_06545 [Lactococcus sp. dk322]